MNHPGLKNSHPLIILIALFLLCQAGFQVISHQMEQVSGTSRILDTRLHYSPGEAQTILTNLGNRGRRLYFYALLIDLIYPVTYSLILWMVMQFLLAKIPGSAETGWRKLRFLPFAAAGCDYLENITEFSMVRRFPAHSDNLAAVGSFFTSAKWTMVSLTFLVIVLLSFRILVLKWRQNGKG